MNSGVLQFVLGLNTGGFLAAVGGADAKLKGFLGSMIGFGAISAGVMKAIDRGAEFEHLHKRTGQSVSDLYELQRGFKEVGISGDDVGQTIFFMQKALGGINEEGQNTADIFYQMGLNISDLKKLNAPQQITAILAAMSKLKPEDAAKAASGIFGRMGAGNMLQVMRSPKEFADGMKEAATQARQLQRDAAAFEEIERSLGRLKNKSMGLFAGIAEGAAPGIQQVLDMLNQIDLSGFGQQLGKILGAFVQAFKEGKLSELIGDSLRLGFDSILIFSPGIFQKIGYELLKAFETPLNFLEAGLTWIELKFVEMLAKFESSLPKGIQNAIGFDDRFKGFKAPSFGEVFKDRQDRGLEMGLVNLGEINASADKSLAEAGKKFREKWEAFQFGLDSFNSRAPKLKPSENFTKTGGVSLARESYTFKPEFNAFEKMGFVMRGGMTNPATEYARRTADNTTKMTSLLEATVQLLGSGGAEPVNAPL